MSIADEIKTEGRNSENILIGKIPVRNIWLLMLYASELFRHQNRMRNIDLDENLDDIPDLVAEILAYAVERRLRRNLSFGYQKKFAALNRVRGRIDLITTKRRHLLEQGKIACRYDDFTVDNPRNRFVRGALEKISRKVRRKELSHRCSSLADTFKRMGVRGIIPNRAEIDNERFGRHDSDERFMIAAAKLAYDLALPTENYGDNYLIQPFRNKEKLRKLFEQAVAGFYSVVLSDKGWKVEYQKPLQWKCDFTTEKIHEILPSMSADIVLNHSKTGRRIIIDTKCTSIVAEGWHREKSLRSSNIYQIYSYVRSQESENDPVSLLSTGMLLYPSVGESIDETAEIQRHPIRFTTVDLLSDARSIRSRLVELIDPSLHL